MPVQLVSRINIAPLMAITVAVMLAGMWLDTRETVTPSARTGVDVAVGIGFAFVCIRSVRGRPIRLGEMHPALRPWLVISLIVGVVLAARVMWHLVAPLLAGG
jgi:hypothetical protein